MLLRISPEFHQPCLLRMERQTKSCKPLRQDFQHPFGILPILEAQHRIIGEAYLVCCPLQAGLHFALKPIIEHIVQV